MNELIDNLSDEEIRDTLDSWAADEYLSSIEANQDDNW